MEIILGPLIIAIVFTALIAFGYEGERTIPGLGLFFLLLFLPIWALSLWIPPVGPAWLGIAWLDIIAFALILSFFILAITPSDYRSRRIKRDVIEVSGNGGGGEYAATMRSYSAAFWAFVAFIIVAILLGSARAQNVTGCWATIYDQADLQGESITLYDGVDFPEMKIGEANWEGRVKSVRTGPKARLSLYGNQFWNDLDYTIQPLTKVTFKQQYPWNNTESLRLECVP